MFRRIILACVVRAKRPLRLEELCEATAAIETEYGLNVDRTRRLFKKQVVSLCQPLVQVQESMTPQGIISICTLAHATVRTFLIRNADVLCIGNGLDVFSLTDKVLADVCVKYLMQHRYQSLLKRSGDTFIDQDGDDVSEHHLLSYAAKYWDKHLDQLPYSEDLGNRIASFVKSDQYFTCLQIQSLLVGGRSTYIG